MTSELTVVDQESAATVRKLIEDRQAAESRVIEAERTAAEARAKAAAASARVDEAAEARQRAWAERVQGSYPAEVASARAAERAAWRTFEASIEAEPDQTLRRYLEWHRSGTELNRLLRRREYVNVVLGTGGTTGQLSFGRVVPYPEALETAIGNATSRSYSEALASAEAEYLAVREDRQPTDDGLRHLEGCPGGRTETYDAERVGKTSVRGDALPSSRPHTPVKVTRCLWCGAQRETER